MGERGWMGSRGEFDAGDEDHYENKEAVYGFPCVENPHDFEPDRDSYTEQEIAFWEDAKRRWDAGDRDVRGNRCHFLTDDKGEPIAHVTATSWGIGVNYVDMEDDEEIG